MGMAEPLLRIEDVIAAPKDEVIGLVRNASPVRFTMLNVRRDRRFGGLAPNTTYGAAVARSHAARADYVAIDLESVKVNKRTYDDEEEVGRPAPMPKKAERGSDLEPLSERRVAPVLGEQRGSSH